jgi:hypothetical protein
MSRSPEGHLQGNGGKAKARLRGLLLKWEEIRLFSRDLGFRPDYALFFFVDFFFLEAAFFFFAAILVENSFSKE